MRLEPTNPRRRPLLAAAVVAALGMGLIQATAAQRAAPPAPRALPAAARGAQIVDLTPTGQVWPREHVLYDFDRNIATRVLLTEEGVEVRSITRLDKVSVRPGGDP